MPREDEEAPPQDAPPQEEQPQEEAPEAPPEGDAPVEGDAAPEGDAPPEQPNEETGEGSPAEDGAEGEQPPAEEEAQDAPPQEASQQMGYYNEEQHRAMKKAEREKRLSELQETRMAKQQAFVARKQALQEAVDAGKQIVHLTCCFDCHECAWCTQHNEKKYVHFENLVKAAVTAELGENYFVAVNSKSPKKLMGSFEVEFNGVVVFSKLEKKYWPHMTHIIKGIKAAGEEQG